jgi:hypothetical protein
MNIDKLNTQAINSKLDSGTINIPVTVNSNPVADKEAATLNYLNQQANQHLLKSNPVMTGSLQLTYTPTDDNHIVSKQYVLDANAQRVNSSQAYFSNKIQNYLPKNGDTITGDLILSGNPVNDFDLATYGYLQNKITSMTSNSSITDGVKTGTIVEVPYNYTYNNSAYLLCNGASVSKTTYSALYGVIGDTFAVTGPGAGIPWQSQYGFNPSTQSDITVWTNANSLTTATEQAASLVTKNYIYILGGFGTTTALNTIQRASFDTNGNLTSSWSSIGTLPISLYRMGYVAARGRFYLIGGSDSTNLKSTVYSTPINADGTLGTFRTETSLPVVIADAVCFVIKNKLYVAGGDQVYNQNTVYKATINTDGTLSSWTQLPNFPISFSCGSPLLINDRIYIFGAFDSSTNTSKIYYATYDSNGDIGSWTYVSNMPNSIYRSAIVCTDNYVFSVSGYSLNNNQYTLASYRAPILIDGSIGTWTQISSGLAAVGFAQSVIAGNKIYFIGGGDNVSNLNTVYSATFTSGITDYTPYYTDQSNHPNTTPVFNLPDLTSRSNTSPQMKYIIKT